ncbi:MAG: CPBP family intramembrane metalloprotease [Saprospiraceae bacterium]|nr:CPBP family intramembrane metalloprotease [Saprospiraceae bacterium]
MRKLHLFFLNTPFVFSFWIFLIVSILWLHLFIAIVNYFKIDVFALSGKIEFETLTEEFFIVVVIAPLMETFLFQYLVFLIFDFFKLNKAVIILVSAALFASIHYYSWVYILFTFGSGLLLGYIYWLCQLKSLRPFILVFSLHGLYNLFVSMMKNIF